MMLPDDDEDARGAGDPEHDADARRAGDPEPGADADEREQRLEAARAFRSTVDVGLPFRDRILDQFFLDEPGDRDTVILLMRGMPLPVTFGFPGCPGGAIWENYVGFVRNFHPSISIACVHPLCPFSAKERLVVFLCSVAFNFLWTAFTTYHENAVEDAISRRLGPGHVVLYALLKHTVTVVYAVLIRQIVICPCLYEPVMRAARDDAVLAAGELAARAAKLRRWKERGDRVLVLLAVFHGAMIAAVIYVVTTENWLRGYRNPQTAVVRRILVAELVNFFVWFLKFAPLFLILYPIHRAQWYCGGDLSDYVLRRRALLAYRTSENYRDEMFPRCVTPETRELRGTRLSSLRKSSGFLTLSTIRRNAAPKDQELVAMPRCRSVDEDGGDDARV